MIWFPLLFGLIIAAILSAVFGVGFRRYGPWEGFVSFFLVLLLAAWAGALWMQPFGPPLLGFYWLPVFALTLLIAVLLASTTPSSRYRPPSERPAGGAAQETAAERGLDAFFWVVLGLLLVMILTGYWL